jgi:hypothetical protein
LWEDVWNGCLLRQEFPLLFSFAKNQNISLERYLQNQDPGANFHIPLSIEAMDEFDRFTSKITEVAQNLQGIDNWQFIWGSDLFSSKIIYMRNFASLVPPEPFS